MPNTSERWTSSNGARYFRRLVPLRTRIFLFAICTNVRVLRMISPGLPGLASPALAGLKLGVWTVRYRYQIRIVEQLYPLRIRSLGNWEGGLGPEVTFDRGAGPSDDQLQRLYLICQGCSLIVWLSADPEVPASRLHKPAAFGVVEALAQYSRVCELRDSKTLYIKTKGATVCDDRISATPLAVWAVSENPIHRRAVRWKPRINMARVIEFSM
ncbi:hypothetical protein V8F20_005911 [Naviculisporaceae sp. PSN 640]